MFVFLNAKNTYNYEIKLSAKKDPLGLFAEAIFLIFVLCLNRLEKGRNGHASKVAFTKTSEYRCLINLVTFRG